MRCNDGCIRVGRCGYRQLMRLSAITQLVTLLEGEPVDSGPLLRELGH